MLKTYIVVDFLTTINENLNDFNILRITYVWYILKIMRHIN